MADGNDLSILEHYAKRFLWSIVAMCSTFSLKQAKVQQPIVAVICK